MPAFTQPFTFVSIATPLPTDGSGVQLFLWGATNTSINAQYAQPAPGNSSYLIQYRRAIDFSFNSVTDASSNAVVSTTINGLAPNTLYSIRLSANGSAFTYLLQGATTGGTGDSPDGSFVGNVFQTITGPGGHVWGFAETNSPMAITVDGVVDNTTSRVVTLVYSGGRICHQNADLNWFFKRLPTDAWAPTSDPRIGVPAVTPLGATQITENAANPGVVMNFGYNLPVSPKITMIFWGTDWNTQPQTAGDVFTRMTNMFASNYFRGLSEYFCNAKPTITTGFIVNSTPPFFTTLPAINNPGVVGGVDPNGAYTALSNFAITLIDNGTMPMPTTNDDMILFVLPNSAGNPPGTAGFHGSFNHRGVQIPFGAGFGFNDIDSYTQVLCHETVETMTDRDVSAVSGTGVVLTGTWSGPGQGSVAGNIHAAELEDFFNQTAQIVGGASVFGYWMNRLGQMGFTV